MKNINSATAFTIQMNSKTWIIASGCMLCLLASACEGPEAQHMFRSQSTPIINGIPDQSEEHRAVVFTKTHASGSSWDYYCSGTLIAPTVVMTAAHCAEGWEPGEYLVHFGFDSSDFVDRYVSEIIYHPNWDPDQMATIGNDIALLRLTTPAPYGIQPIPHLPADLAITSNDIGTQLEYVGFGQDENGQTGRKLTINLPLWGVCTTSGGCNSGSFHLAANTICESAADGGGICHGDSGGPAFVERGGVEYVAGVASYGYGDCDSISCSTKVDFFESWINDFIGSFTVNGRACTNPAQCYSGLCVDGVCCESACDAPCMTCAASYQTVGQCTPSPDGEACPDSDPCNGFETCQAGVCVSDGVTPDCTPSVPCVTGSCVTGQGCVNTPLADGTACDNDNICDGDDACQAGKCVSRGTTLDCDDANPCTDDSCNASQGCQHAGVADGSSCDDSDPCNGSEVCSAGSCQPGQAPDCDDGNACTTDSCDSSSGCAHQDLPEGSDCGGGRSCQDGLCLPKKGGDCNTAGAIPRVCWPLLVLMLLAGGLRRRLV